MIFDLFQGFFTHTLAQSNFKSEFVNESKKKQKTSSLLSTQFIIIQKGKEKFLKHLMKTTVKFSINTADKIYFFSFPPLSLLNMFIIIIIIIINIDIDRIYGKQNRPTTAICLLHPTIIIIILSNEEMNNKKTTRKNTR